MVEALTGGFRAAQVKLATSRVLSEAAAAYAVESVQIVSLAILIREKLEPAQFKELYRPFATVVPGPGYVPPVSVDRQIATFVQRLPTLAGAVQAEASVVARALSEPTRAAVSTATGVAAAPKEPDFDVAALYAAAWKSAIAKAAAADRTQALRATQDWAESVAPHDGSGLVSVAGVAAGAIFLRDLLPIEQVLLLYEPFAGAFPYQDLS
jgi:hypothetical protein